MYNVQVTVPFMLKSARKATLDKRVADIRSSIKFRLKGTTLGNERLSIITDLEEKRWKTHIIHVNVHLEPS